MDHRISWTQGATVQPTMRGCHVSNPAERYNFSYVAMATHRRLARESQRCLGAFKDPFHRRLLGGNARDEWISAPLRVGGLDRRHSVCLFFFFSVWVFVCLHVSDTLSGKR